MNRQTPVKILPSPKLHLHNKRTAENSMYSDIRIDIGMILNAYNFRVNYLCTVVPNEPRSNEQLVEIFRNGQKGQLG